VDLQSRFAIPGPLNTVPGLLVSVYAVFVEFRQIMRASDRQINWAVAIFIVAIALLAILAGPGSVSANDDDWRDPYTRAR
jgi:hypothetical protein